MRKQGIWRAKGFGSIYEYAAKLAGMNHEKVNDCLRIMKKIEDKPELLQVVAQKGINAVRPVASIATKKTAKFWAEKAIEMSKNVLETYVRDARTSTDNGLEKVEMELDPKVANMLKKMKGDRDWNTFMKELMDGQQKPESVKTDSQYIPKEIKKYVVTKTNCLCAYPGCNKPAEEFHHTKRFSLDKEHNPDHIVPLCKAHHQLAHHGLIANEEKPSYEWTVLTEPDTTNPKYNIDLIVQEHRTGYFQAT